MNATTSASGVEKTGNAVAEVDGSEQIRPDNRPAHGGDHNRLAVCCGSESGSDAGGPEAFTEDVHAQVRAYYAERAVSGSSCCGGGCGSTIDPVSLSTSVGYSPEDMEDAPEGANLGLGCGNPTAIDTIREGDVVLDLGSGAGIDCFLAAKKVGASGKVIGVDMTPEMLSRARMNARAIGANNVEFRLGEIEHLPVADASVDVVISNCVINLSPDKPRVFREAFRALKSGGRLMVSDLVLARELPDFLRTSVEAYAACIAGASPKEAYLSMIEDAGFADARVAGEVDYLGAVGAESVLDWIAPERRDETRAYLRGGAAVVSLSVWAVKP